MKYGQPTQTNQDDKPSGGLQVVSFLFPIIGWILWGVHRSAKPVSAKSYAQMAWIGLGIGLLINFL